MALVHLALLMGVTPVRSALERLAPKSEVESSLAPLRQAFSILAKFREVFFKLAPEKLPEFRSARFKSTSMRLD